MVALAALSQNGAERRSQALSWLPTNARWWLSNQRCPTSLCIAHSTVKCMRDQHPIRTARRKARQNERERLGLAETLCVHCIEDHHTAGRKHDSKLTTRLCKKHHREIQEQMLRAGISLRYERNPVRRAA